MWRAKIDRSAFIIYSYATETSSQNSLFGTAFIALAPVMLDKTVPDSRLRVPSAALFVLVRLLFLAP